VGDVEVGITVGFADDDEAGFFGGGDVFVGDFDEEAPGVSPKRSSAVMRPAAAGILSVAMRRPDIALKPISARAAAFWLFTARQVPLAFGS
jgi:hypothetical protein